MIAQTNEKKKPKHFQYHCITPPPIYCNIALYVRTELFITNWVKIKP